MPLKRLGVAAAVILLAAAAAAEDAQPLTFTVRPSGVEDAGAAARRRQELLSRRLEDAAWSLRAICRQCSREIDRNLSPAPFRPLETLDGSPRRRDG